MANLQAQANQVTPDTINEGSLNYASMSKLGGLFTADWKQQLINAGLAWVSHVGALTESADVAAVTGGGDGTSIDADQPEFIIGVDAGYSLIPMEVHASMYVHTIEDKKIHNMVLMGDRTTAPQTSMGSGTLMTPVNLLDGGAAFPGRAWQAVSGNQTATATMDELLDYVSSESLAASGSSVTEGLKMDYMPLASSIMRGPCSVVLCFGSSATSGAQGMGVVKVACVPNSYFPIE